MQQWVCSCGERHDDDFDTCWRCGADKIDQARTVGKVAHESASGSADLGDSMKTLAVPASEPLREMTADEPFPLLQNETVLEAIGINAVILTTHRIRAYGLGAGASSFVSIMLEQVASSSIDLVTKPWMLGCACISFVVALTMATRHDDDWWVPILAGIVFIAAYFLTRRVVVSISSAAASVQFSSSAASEMAVQTFINKLENAKDLRYRLCSRTEMTMAARPNSR